MRRYIGIYIYIFLQETLDIPPARPSIATIFNEKKTEVGMIFLFLYYRSIRR